MAQARATASNKFVASAKPGPPGRTSYFQDGLELLVSAKCKKLFWHYTNLAGVRCRLPFGSYPATGLAAARTRALEAKGLLEGGQDPRAAAAAEKAAPMALRELVESYLQKRVRPNLRSAPSIERRFKKNVIPVVGDVPVSDLHRRHVNAVLDPILDRGKPIEARKVFEDFRACCRWAVTRGDLDRSPLEGMTSPAASPPRERVLNDDELRAVWNGLPAAMARAKDIQRILRLCLVLGQRCGEISGMRLDELDLRNGLWTLPGSRTKNKHQHRLPLPPLAIDIIEQAVADAGPDSPFVFPARDGEATDSHNVARALRRTQRQTKDHPLGRLGVVHFTPHDCRRTVLDGLARLGVLPVVAAAIANHMSGSRASVTQRFYQPYSYEREKADALNRWADHLEAIIAGKKSADVVPMIRPAP